MHSDAKSLRERGDRLFSAKRPIDLRNQEIAEHFYPEVAEFTVKRDIGDDFAGHLMSGYPVMVRRDLGNSIGSMLRPKAQQWFHIRADREEKEDHTSRAWMDRARDIQKRAMYDRVSQFTRATKEADHSFATFGEAVISVEMNRRDNALLYRNWHLRDVAWAEDAFGQIAEVHRNWSPTLAELCMAFPGKVHEKVIERKEKEPFGKIKVRHVVISTEIYGGDRFKKFPYVSMFVDVENSHIMQEVGSWSRKYVIPRWATIPGSQYSCSPATVVALPDARLLQAQVLTLLEAGEKAVNPPMVGVGDAMRSSLDIRAGGFTSVDADYDERLGSVLRPLSVDKSGLPFGLDLAERTSAQIREAFYLNTLSMPPAGGPEMTAYEVGQRVQEYIRQALPLFEPMEDEYNAALCDMTFDTLMREGAFGPAEEIPDAIRGTEIRFTFESPLAEQVDRQKSQTFLEAKAVLAEVAAVDPTAIHNMDFQTTLRDVLDGIGVPAKWMRSEADVEARVENERRAQQAQALLGEMEQSAGVAEKLGNAASNFGQMAA